MSKLSLVHEQSGSLRIWYGDQELAQYVYLPTDQQLESPRPYWHPLRTLGGDEVSLYRPHDHVWHKGIAFSLPNLAGPEGTENFWGGPTYLRGRDYVQLPNDGSMVHREFLELNGDGEQISLRQRLDWVTQAGRRWVAEERAWSVQVVAERGWLLRFATRLTNVAGHDLVFGSPTTEGRDNAGYGGLFWRGPRSFSGGTAYLPTGSGRDELMGARSPWLGFTGQHDDHGRRSTLVFVDAPENPGHPTRWFVRSEMFACVCPAPFFADEFRLAPGETLPLRHAVAIADGDLGQSGAEQLATTAAQALAQWEVGAP